jgi:hypothetical protein
MLWLLLDLFIFFRSKWKFRRVVLDPTGVLRVRLWRLWDRLMLVLRLVFVLRLVLWLGL